MRYSKTNGLVGDPLSVNFDPGGVNCGEGLDQYGRGRGQFGNAVLMLGVWNGSPADYYFAGADQKPQGDYRAFSCMTMSTYFGVRQGCVSHLDSRDAGVPDWMNDYNNRQDLAVTWLSTLASNAGTKVVVGLDRNRTDVNSWGAFTEIDRASPKLRTWPNNAPDVKLDWVFGGAGHGGVPGTGRYCPSTSSTPISDHCMLLGNFAI